MTCPFCDHKHTKTIYDLLIDEAMSSTALESCENCKGIFGRHT